MTWRGKLRRLFSVRVADISGVGSAAATAAPADGLHRPYPTTTSLTELPRGETPPASAPPVGPDPDG